MRIATKSSLRANLCIDSAAMAEGVDSGYVAMVRIMLLNLLLYLYPNFSGFGHFFFNFDCQTTFVPRDSVLLARQ